MTIRKEGEKNLLLILAIFIIPRIICSAALKSAITPSRKGRIVLILSCVFPCICRAFSPMAITFSVRRSMATIEGSLTTILSLFIMMVLAVPRSTAISCDKKENNPMSLLVFEMSHSCKNHCNPIFISSVYRFLIPNGSPRLDNRCDSGFMSRLYTV